MERKKYIKPEEIKDKIMQNAQKWREKGEMRQRSQWFDFYNEKSIIQS